MTSFVTRSWKEQDDKIFKQGFGSTQQNDYSTITERHAEECMNTFWALFASSLNFIMQDRADCWWEGNF